MKFTGLLLLFTAMCLPAEGQVLSNCAVPASLQQAYQQDVADLAFARMYELKSSDTSLIEIPQRWEDSIYSALAAVYNLDTRYEADSIFRNYCIHRRGWYTFMPQRLTVAVDTNYAWAKQWAHNKTPTNDPAIDGFLQLHEVSFSIYSVGIGYAELTANHLINTMAFADSLRKFPGVLSCDLSYPCCDGGNILYREDAGTVHLQFHAGWGDCFVGCISSKNWFYTISTQDCNVRLDSITGSSGGASTFGGCDFFPEPLGVQPTYGLEALVIYPNPATELLHISGAPDGPLHVVIFDALGRRIKEDILARRLINVEGLHAGFYTVLIDDASHRRAVRSFVKLN